MFLTANEQRALGARFGLLAQDLTAREIRQGLAPLALDLFRADYFASYVWTAAAGRFDDGASLNINRSNLSRYEDWYQYRDPITFLLQSRHHATLVSEVMPRREFLRT